MDPSDQPLPPLRKVDWLGDSRKRVSAWPKDVRVQIGEDLMVVQLGEYPHGCEAMPELGNGVHAIRAKLGKEHYRVMWIATLAEAVYVLHAFHKKSKKGVATPKGDVDLAKKRLKDVRALLSASAPERSKGA